MSVAIKEGGDVSDWYSGVLLSILRWYRYILGNVESAFTVESIGDEQSMLGDAVINAGDVRGERLWGLAWHPIMTDEDGRISSWIASPVGMSGQF